MEQIPTTSWAWAIGFGIFSIVLLFCASEGLVRSKLNAPSIIVAGFLIALASISLSFFLACLGDFQIGCTDTLDDINRAYRQVTWYLHF
jgi:hypothetical protein